MVFKTANAVVGQSGGPTAAINATLAGVIKGCLDSDKIDKIYGMRNGIAGFEKEDIIEIGGYFSGKEDNLKKLSMTPAAALGSCRKKLDGDEQIKRIYTILEKYNIRYFFYIGGNDSMDTVAKLYKYANEHKDEGLFEVNFIGVPKTIDNDLCFTDHTPGYGSAAKFVATTMQEIMRDCAVSPLKAVTIVEIMGRDAGWLTASAAITRYVTGVGPDLIYVPEVVFDQDDFLNKLNHLLENGENPYVVVAVSEGLKNASGEYIANALINGKADDFGHKIISGAGKYLEQLVKEKIGCKCRSVELNVLQRCASHIASLCDIEESLEIGESAVKSATNGESGKMMCFVREKNGDEYKSGICSMDVTGAANKAKCIPQEFLMYDGSGVNEKCIEYILPLVKGELEIEYKDGLPVHFSF